MARLFGAKVDKIVGPGNIFVATAKRLVFGEVNIDSIAGPSEILLLVDASADPRHVAADLLSHAEHDELAAALCVTTSMPAAVAIQQAVEHQVSQSKRQGISLKALANYGAIILARGGGDDRARQRDRAEHVELIVKRPEIGRADCNAGAIFCVYWRRRWRLYGRAPIMCCPRRQRARFFPAGHLRFLETYDDYPSGKAGAAGAGAEDHATGAARRARRPCARSGSSLRAMR